VYKHVYVFQHIIISEFSYSHTNQENSVSSSAENKEEIRANQLVQVDSMLSKLSRMNEVSWLLVVGHYPIYTGGNCK
jgi:hypothetical protein